MIDVFQEVELIKEMLEKSEYKVSGLTKYYDDILHLSFASRIEFETQEIYLDYISYLDYVRLMTTNFKALFATLNQDIQSSYTEIQALKYLMKCRIEKICDLSLMSREDLLFLQQQFGFNISFESYDFPLAIYLYTKEEFTLNPLISDFCSQELEDFLNFYINAKNRDNSVSLEDAFQMYNDIIKLNKELK